MFDSGPSGDSREPSSVCTRFSASCPPSAVLSGAMADINAASDDDNTPPGSVAAVPEARSGWSEQDRRTLIITLGGTLAANLATVLIVGMALAYVRAHRTHGSYFLVENLIFLAVGFFSIVVGNFFRRRAQVGTDDVKIGWTFVVLGCIWEVVTVISLIGLAAGAR